MKVLSKHILEILFVELFLNPYIPIEQKKKISKDFIIVWGGGTTCFAQAQEEVGGNWKTL